MTTPKPPIEWHVLDASTQTLGRLATQAASLLMGKHRPDALKRTLSPVRVIVTNSDNVKVTGKKKTQKMYRWYTGYPGGLKERTMEDQMGRDSRVIIQQAVFGMLPKNNLRDDRMKQLFVYPTAEHPHMAQIK